MFWYVKLFYRSLVLIIETIVKLPVVLPLIVIGRREIQRTQTDPDEVFEEAIEDMEFMLPLINHKDPLCLYVKFALWLTGNWYDTLIWWFQLFTDDLEDSIKESEKIHQYHKAL